jgi:hypothetical protein
MQGEPFGSEVGGGGGEVRDWVWGEAGGSVGDTHDTGRRTRAWADPTDDETGENRRLGSSEGRTQKRQATFVALISSIDSLTTNHHYILLFLVNGDVQCIGARECSHVAHVYVLSGRDGRLLSTGCFEFQPNQRKVQRQILHVQSC